MKTYEVLIPITGYICIELEAEVQAKELAMEKANNGVFMSKSVVAMF